ncbi:MAG: aryl-sulfate sulfotransferase [Bacteroidota bacterium]|nr:aryl-sulfate sulfotransferase [Bacteroidota bacterium]
MKKACFFLLLFSGIAAIAVGQTTTKDSTGKKLPPPKDRNMFGLHVPRGLVKTSDGLADGYVLFGVPNSPLVYLINRKGEVVHQWKSNYGSSAVSAYLQPDGSLIQNVVDPDFPVFAGGGESGRIQKISWDSKILWDFEYATEEYLHHHDFAVMPNGHILAIAWEAKTAEEVAAAGRKPNMIPKAGLWPDKIVEIVPDGQRHGNIVWEWHIWNHLVQDFDSKKANYGKPANHPELLDFNVGDTVPPLMTQAHMDSMRTNGHVWRNQTPENEGSEVYHFNAIKYNADLDQIVFSSPNMSEIFIIDHSTTSKEAAGHKGGKYGKGGDFLYRWGNPKNYHHGDSADEKLFGQHDVRWIEKDKPGAGDLTVFDNDVPSASHIPYSAVLELTTPTDKNGNYFLEKNGTFGPEKPTWKYMAADTFSFFSSFISGAHRMSNGNTFIDQGAAARFFEVTPEGKIVWEYWNPYRGDIHMPNGDPINPIPLTYFAFRANFIPADHPGLANKKLEPLNPQPEAFKLPPMPPPPGQ